MAPHLWSMWKDIKNFKVIIGTTGYHILLGQVRTRTPYWQLLFSSQLTLGQQCVLIWY